MSFYMYLLATHVNSLQSYIQLGLHLEAKGKYPICRRVIYYYVPS